MRDKLKIGFFYKEELNLYGDNGNIEALVYRASRRNIQVEVMEIDTETKMNSSNFTDINFIFMGGGPDSAQKNIYKDLISNKKEYLRDYIEAGGVSLFVCGAFQLMGKYYLSSDNSTLEGLNIFSLYTKHYGPKKPRCIGNTAGEISGRITQDPVFKNVNRLDNYLVGFENHGGRTYLEDKEHLLSNVIKGHGNNSEDNTEGCIHLNSIGTYYHGPLLAKNPHLSDYLLAKALNTDTLEVLEDVLENKAHTASLKLKE
ncbi:MAG TPA: hypothetical protein PKK07_00075 [bacterium]|jgi:CobQ-like glutamine amidotransferase family enzyme|nr:hypothetical protein [bacterium]HOA18548.1 hypothetical protein [bacterium]